ncbi:hypothetical protein L9F63_010760, partial [Diploptera punctata]
IHSEVLIIPITPPPRAILVSAVMTIFPNTLIASLGSVLLTDFARKADNNLWLFLWTSIP